MQFAYMDVNNGTLPEQFQSSEKYPHLQFMPAHSKNSHPYKSARISSIENMMNFIKENAYTDVSKAFKPFEDQQDEAGYIRTQDAETDDSITEDL